MWKPFSSDMLTCLLKYCTHIDNHLLQEQETRTHRQPPLEVQKVFLYTYKPHCKKRIVLLTKTFVM